MHFKVWSYQLVFALVQSIVFIVVGICKIDRI
jgi:hypothetical protein